MVSIKLFLFGLFSLIYLMAQAQVGINTQTPQGVFHVDPKSNTSGTSNVSDDFIVTSSGTVGIGVLSPVEKLDINGGLRIASPSAVTANSQLYNPMYWDQSTGKVLVTNQTTKNAAMTIQANKYTMGVANNTAGQYMHTTDNTAFYLPAITASSTSEYIASSTDPDVFSVSSTTGNIKIKNRGKNILIQYNQNIRVSLASTTSYPTTGMPPQLLCSIKYGYRILDSGSTIDLGISVTQNKQILPRYVTSYGQRSNDTYYSLSSPFSSTFVIPVALMPVAVGSYFYLCPSINIYSASIQLGNFYSDGFGLDATSSTSIQSSYYVPALTFSISEF